MNNYNAKYIAITMDNKQKHLWIMITTNNDNTQYNLNDQE